MKEKDTQKILRRRLKKKLISRKNVWLEAEGRRMVKRE